MLKEQTGTLLKRRVVAVAPSVRYPKGREGKIAQENAGAPRKGLAEDRVWEFRSVVFFRIPPITQEFADNEGKQGTGTPFCIVPVM